MYSNFDAIFMLAIVGTVLAVIVISTGLCLVKLLDKDKKLSIQSLSTFEIISFAALITSTDPISTLSIYSQRNVDSTLFYIVFGESILVCVFYRFDKSNILILI